MNESCTRYQQQRLAKKRNMVEMKITVAKVLLTNQMALIVDCDI